MQALWLENKQLRLRDDLPVPVPATAEALVRVRLAGICATDLELIGGYYPFAGVPGHEFVAPLPGVTETMEILVREPAPLTAVTGLQQTAPVEVEEGVTYRRYVGADLADQAVGLILADEPVTVPVEWAAVLLAFLLTGTAIFAMQRSAADPRVAPVTMASDRRQVLRELAVLDEAYEREGKPAGKAGSMVEKNLSTPFAP